MDKRPADFSSENSIQGGKRRLLVDVSVLFKSDAGTGIQRVVRMIGQRIFEWELRGWEVIPVFATRDCGFRMAPRNFLRSTAMPKPIDVDTSITVNPGDLFLALDLSPKLIVRHRSQLLHWQSQGIRLVFMVYDLLPLSNGSWFGIRNRINFIRWFHFVKAHADHVVCISNTVAELVRHRFGVNHHADISVIPLGWDSLADVNASGDRLDPATSNWFQERATLLCVGTVEPRKGHACLLSACEWLWQHMPDLAPNLLCVGRPGWKSGRLRSRMQQLAIHQTRFRWALSADDSDLRAYFNKCAGLVAASKGEGFGLPIVEALYDGVPVLARDMSVFREISSDAIAYFSDDRPELLGRTILTWMELSKKLTHRHRSSMYSWNKCSADLLRLLGLNVDDFENRF